MMVGYSQRNSRQILLATSQAKLASIFSRAKALSIQTYFQAQTSDEAICGHGVYLDLDDQENQKVFIFQDIDTLENGRCDTDPDAYTYDAGIDRPLVGELNEALLGSRGVYISESDSDYVIFIPPAPDVAFDDTDLTELSLNLTDGDVNLRVIVTEDGQIRIE